MSNPFPPQASALIQDIRSCTRCALHLNRKQAVPGTGPIPCTVAAIGEKIAGAEDTQGIPFVGPAGAYLNSLLSAIGLNRDEIYITNITRCRVPDGQDPTFEQIQTCTNAYLYAQLNMINPLLILTFGRYSTGLFFGGKITDLQGQPRHHLGRIFLPTFHPAAVLHNPSLGPALRASFDLIPSLLQQAKTLNPNELQPFTPPTPLPAQLNLF